MTRRRPASAPRPPMSDEQHAAITCELVRLVIGPPGPCRPELEAPDAIHPDFKPRHHNRRPARRTR